MNKIILKSGYTTGTHSTALVGAIFYNYFFSIVKTNICVRLPDLSIASIDVFVKNGIYFTQKVYNDDLDVTKGIFIYVLLRNELPKNLKPQNPSILNINNSNLFVYAGDGVGVVTKKGLKIPPNYPAINPVPLDMMRNIIKDIIKDREFNDLHIIFGIKDGEEIALKTANKKVGVIGGLSILGTKGIVKPISSSAYIDSIAVEISVLNALGEDIVVFTLGNSAYDYAKRYYKEQNIIEIGNFVYESLQLLYNSNFKKILFITSVAKMAKVAQGCKNTHNRFGGINFQEINRWLESINISPQKEVTLKGVLENLLDNEIEKFLKLLHEKSSRQLKLWLQERNDIKVESLILYKN